MIELLTSDFLIFGSTLLTFIGTVVYVQAAHPQWLDEPGEVGAFAYLSYAVILPLYGWTNETALATVISVCLILAAWNLTGSGRFGGIDGPFGTSIKPTSKQNDQSE